MALVNTHGLIRPIMTVSFEMVKEMDMENGFRMMEHYTKVIYKNKIGEFLHDAKHGKGKETYVDGTWFEGQFEMGERVED